ncbi:MAG: inositol monophosphatase family protein [Actinomycetota bacterium]
MDYSAEFAFAVEVAKEGGERALRGFGTALAPERKSDGTWVTEVDKAVETLIRRRIADAYPNHNILGEEEGLTCAGGGQPIDGAPTWIVDPIDGTNNFMSGIPIWATLVALRVDDESVLGVVHAARLGETYEAVVGGGARCNGEPIEVSPTDELADAAVLFASVQSFPENGLQEFFAQLTERTWRSRGFGDFWGHMLVARGAAHIMIEPKLSLWDVAALEPIVSEAGGKLTTLDGAPFTHGSSALTTNAALHEKVLSLAKEFPPS